MDFITNNWELFLRLVLAMVLGGFLGLEREFAHKMAGLRTYALISCGAALFVIISILVSQQFIGITQFDPLRVASQIIVGIGFVGAGLIIFRESEHKVGGITTAAGLWFTAGIGMACGFGFYPIAIFTALLGLFIFSVLGLIDRHIRSKNQE